MTYTLSLRSSTMLFKGLLALGWRWWLIFVVMIDAFKGFDFAIGSTVTLAATSLSVTAEMVLSRLSSKRSGVGGVDSSTTAIVGRNKEAMTILWLRKEDIDDCWEWSEWTDIETGTYRSMVSIWLFGMPSSDSTHITRWFRFRPNLTWKSVSLWSPPRALYFSDLEDGLRTSLTSVFQMSFSHVCVNTKINDPNSTVFA